MNEVIETSTKTPIEIVLGIGEDGKTTARKLYEFLEMDSTHYGRWIKSNILENPFAEENTDYEVLAIDGENPKGGRPTRDFKLSANFAKKLSMQGKTERAEQARDYFIKVEDKLKEIATKGIRHNVQQLTVTSRDIAVMIGGRAKHHFVLSDIRECIAELSEIGFNPKEFFTESTYITRMNNTAPQYLCTERGCEYYSGRLEPDARKAFLEEITDRFERMQNVLDGKPVKKPLKLPKLISMDEVQEKEPLIRLYKTDNGGIVLMNDELHNLTEDEIETLSRFIPELENSNIGQIQYVVSAFLRSMKKSGKLEEVASWGIKQEEPKQALLPDKAAPKPKRSSSRDDDAPFITAEQAVRRYNMSREKIVALAKEADASIKYGNIKRYDKAKIDAYLAKEYSE